jgi:serine/threonine protein kinase/Tol biopolymer transport system component
MSRVSTGSLERWRRVEDLCERALALDSRERPAFLAEACGADEALRREVESLLANASKAERFLDPSALAAAAHVVVNPPIAALTGRRIGTYEFAGQLGVGGMGEVYRARDTKLGRDVAIKVLPPAFTADRDRLARFEREARVLASLNHPNVAAIYGLEQIGDVQALVLELVEGDTLAERIGGRSSDRPIPIAEVLAIARQIADGLEAAHEKGIVHRDLKPANIKVTPTGTVKVLDFGLAKSGAGSAPDLSQSPTITISGTRDGVLLGTAAYMSPEQARGQSVDKRADIWAFGCVLFEMLTGRITFPGATVSDHIAAILEREPDWSAVPASTPAAIQRLLRRCLEKDPNRRLHDIADARIEIDDALTRPTTSVTEVSGESPRRTDRVAWFVAGVLLVALSATLATGWIVGWKPSAGALPGLSTTRPVTRLVVQPSVSAPLAGGFAISPDGSMLVYRALDAGTPRLFLRRLNQFDAASLAGTDDGYLPVFSPDGRWIAFGANGKLKKVGVTAGESPIVLCDVRNMQGAMWSTDNAIIFGAGNRGLQRVSAEGGQPQALTTLDANRHEIDHHNPELLPGGKALLFTIHEGSELFRVGVQSLGSDERRVLIEAGFDAHYAQTGHLVYANGHSVFAVPFDLERVAVTGAPVKLLDNVATIPADGVGNFSLSASGSLVFLPEMPHSDRALVWVDRSGAETPVPLPRRSFNQPRLSPDGQRLAVTIDDEREDIWVYEFATGRFGRVTLDGMNRAPVWTPDGQRFAFTSVRGDLRYLMVRRADGSASPDALVSGRNNLVAAAWAPDGRTLVYVDSPPSGEAEIAVSGLGDPRVLPLNPAPPRFYGVNGPTLSPDGKWLAFVGLEPGRGAIGEIYIVPFPGAGPRYQITEDGGWLPIWSRDGREIFYGDGKNGLLTVPISTTCGLVAGKPVLLFRGRYRFGGAGVPGYDVTNDGRRFLMVKPSDDELAPRRLHVVLNWADELARRVPSGVRR